MFLTLASFQLAEYNVCTGYGLPAEQWSRAGFVAITALPALAIHLLYKLAGKRVNWLPLAAYLLMLVFMFVFLTYKSAFVGYKCTGNYVIFQMGPILGGAYSIYYFGLLALGIGLATTWVNKLKAKGKTVHHHLQATQALIIGYLIFLIPTALALTFQPSTRNGIPSVMCGFAVIFALILGLYILPRVASKRA